MPILADPEISQWTDTADAFRTDCLPASIGMVLAFYHRLGNLTVNDLSAETTLAQSDTGLPSAAGVKLAARHGLTMKLNYGTTLAQIRAEIDALRPVIALVAYRFITGRLDTNDNNPATDGHFFVILGYDDTHVVVNDPDYWNPYIERGHNVLIPVKDIESALAGDNFNSQCLFLEDLSMNDQIIALANQIIALASQPDSTPTPLPGTTMYATDKLNVRPTPDTSGKVIATLLKGDSVQVVDAVPAPWKQIMFGPYLNDYVSGAFLSTTHP
jgi:uncharacterized protein YgiM (DUF1202 family)